ncbi:MAG TPA: hypothetical protein DCZ03_03510 [Gammaproteobacteria bacterium]|nr:hypothetical protein [Gammaproteobacteria bacterium]
MDRLHLFEWEDQPWCPKLFRNYITDHLQLLQKLVKLYHPMVDKILRGLDHTASSRVVDLCSGGGGPWPGLIEVMNGKGQDIQVTLTDLYPNQETFDKLAEHTNQQIAGRMESTSAFDVPADLPGFRTIFTGLHHFRPEDAKKILADAVNKRVGIGAFEGQERHWLIILMVPVAVFVAALLLTPFSDRLSAQKLFFTYILPIAPLLFAWDGFASCWRTYSPRELRILTRDLESEEYRFEIGQVAHRPLPFGPKMRLTYLIGLPQNN